MTRSRAVIVLGSLFASLFAGAGPALADPAAGDRPVSSAPLDEDEPPYRCKDHTAPVVVTLKADTDVKDLIAWVMGFTCKKFVLDPRVTATGRKVTLIAPRPVSAGEAYRMFLAALTTVGLTVVPHGDALRIVDAHTMKSEPVPLVKSGSPGELDQLVRYVYRPSYIAAEPLRQAWQAMKSDGGDVVALGAFVMVTDYAGHVREMLSFAKLVDVPGGSDGIYTLPVRHADATKLAEKLTAILSLPAGGGARPAVADPARADAGKLEATATPSKIIVDERTNTLIIASGDAGYQRLKALVERLDVALEIEGGSAIHVYPLGGAIAEELAKTLTSAISDGRAPRPGSGAPPPAPGATAPGATAAGAPLDALGAALEGQVRVIADPPTNSLIVMSSGRDFLAIKEVIRQLDLPRRQVYIETVILDVDVTDRTTLGAVSHGGTLAGGTDGPALFGGVETKDVNSLALLGSLQQATGLFAGLVGPALPGSQSLFGQSIPSFSVLFRAVADQSNVHVVSTPSIIAVDNIEAKYSVGTSIAVQKVSFTGITGGATPPGALSTQIDHEPLPLTLNIKPHISKDDTVLLEVKHESKELIDDNNKLGPDWSIRSFDTRVVVRDQQTVVLGGLTQERMIASTTKVPLLGDIPLIGYLFKTTTRSKHQTNLVILLTPYIIRDQRDLQAIQQRKLREHQEFARSFAELEHMTYEARIDYGKKRGLLEDINRAVLDVEQDQAGRAAITGAGPRGVEAGSVDIHPPTAP